MYKNLHLIKSTLFSHQDTSKIVEDDTLITYIGNFIFTKIGNIFFNLEITDILYTFVIGKVESFKNLNMKIRIFHFV